MQDDLLIKKTCFTVISLVIIPLKVVLNNFSTQLDHPNPMDGSTLVLLHM
jgi:hypothetical protein